MMILKRSMRRSLSGLCILVLTVSLVGCGFETGGGKLDAGDSENGGNSGTAARQMSAVNLLENVEGSVAGITNATTDTDAYRSFSLSLLKSCMGGDENTLISPLSIIEAIGMTALGAEGNTRQQFSDAFGTDIGNMALYIKSKNASISKSGTLRVANSVWYKDAQNISIKNEYLSGVKGIFGAQAFKAAFDSSTIDDINGWVSENTDGMISDILEQISSDEVMYLVNAVAFDGEWETKYEEVNLSDGIFNANDGTKQNVTMMYSKEAEYLEDELATGFVKYYKGGDYALVALLPDQSVDISDYVEALDADRLKSLFENRQYTEVHCTMPKFSVTFDMELSGVLKALGITDAFSEKYADFSGMEDSSDMDLYISQVLHKSFIDVNENGTRAAAATSIGMARVTALIEDYKTVYLNRPFLYVIVDCEDWQPVFMGVLMKAGE